MAAVMTAESGDNDKIAEAVAECTALGIEVLAPDVNESLANFTVIDAKHIRFGLAAIKNLGSDVIATIIAERRESGPFPSLMDFVRRMHTRNFNKKSWEALVKSGALDRYGERNMLLVNTEIVLEYARREQKQLSSGQAQLLGQSMLGADELGLAEAVPATEPEKLSWEKEFLGLYVSAHPLKQHRDLLVKYCKPISQITAADEGEYFTLGGIITRIQNIITKKGDPMCFADLEDESGKLELVVFPNVYSEFRSLLAVDQIVLTRGKISDKDGDPKLLADALKSIADEDLEKWANSKGHPSTSSENKKQLVPERSASGVEGQPKDSTTKLLKIKIPRQADPKVFTKLKIVFDKFPGQVGVSLVIPDREGTEREIKTDFAVDGTDAFKTELRELLRESIIKA